MALGMYVFRPVTAHEGRMYCFWSDVCHSLLIALGNSLHFDVGKKCINSYLAGLILYPYFV